MVRLSGKLILFGMILSIGSSFSQYNNNKFKQLKEEWRSPNVYRNAAGAPGHQYYQNRADYIMDIRIDDNTQKLYGEATIKYYNNSPDALEYLWLQLDQNMRAQDSDSKKIQSMGFDQGMSMWALKRMHNEYDGGFKIEHVKDSKGLDVEFTINKTMMRVELDKPLAPKASTSLKIKWWYNINNRDEVGGRAGYEYFPDEDNYLYTMAQFYPRMCVYNDIEGWQNKQFLGAGEFTLCFGNYNVNISVPSDHIVGSTGVLQNAKSVLTSEQQKRFEKAKTADQPVLIVTQEEAEKTEKTKEKGLKTWVFKADNVRDFGFASSRKFIWDAIGVKFGNRTVMAMSYYPKEGNPLWEQYSTKVVAHTIRTYSKYTFDYPYPVAISVHTKNIGMEYPMICFNGGRPESDGTYSARTKYGMISVIIHEVGHNYFPMIVNSDERQWTWMDEGLNTFLQYLTEQEWERQYPSRRGPAFKIVDYMKGDVSNISPIMSNSENIHQFGNNAYGKPATALNILRETVMGRELFDYSFKVYSQRWMFKQPTPEDFFRTMEDASGVDLDWFWRGWFYSTDHVDISLDRVSYYKLATKNPETDKAFEKEIFENGPERKSIDYFRYKEEVKQTVTEADPSTMDFYNKFNPYEVLDLDKKEYEKFLKNLPEDEKKILEANYNYYQLDFSNVGGLVMPIIVEFTFEDGTKEKQYVPAEIWRKNNYQVSKIFFFKKKVTAIQVDPNYETADTDVANNGWPAVLVPSKFDLYRSRGNGENTMQRANRNAKK